MKYIIFINILIILNINAQTTTITYSPSSEDFPNPERGFYRVAYTSASNYEPLEAAELAGYRLLHSPGSGANYQIYATLVLREWELELYKNGPIAGWYLENIANDFLAARQAGVKLIIRFAYTYEQTPGFEPPYGDAPKDIVLQHLAQLQPILLANADVIFCAQYGFIGTWGEGYYTDYFGDASQPPYYLTTQNWSDRNEVLQAWLSALPPERMIQVRYPQAKQKFVYGPDADENSPPMSPDIAYSGNQESRIGHHNDCFLASETDYGTYASYGPPVAYDDTTVYKSYLAADSRFTVTGGETCNDWNPYSNCANLPGGNGDLELERMHFNYLNSQYNNQVNNDWVSGSCMENIKRRLGYRLSLISGEYGNSVASGQGLPVDFSIKNSGYAALVNPRDILLVARHAETGVTWAADLPDNLQSIGAGETHDFNHHICIPDNMPPGTYHLYLWIPDPMLSLRQHPGYAIRLANEGNLWDPVTAYHDLLHHFVVDPAASQPVCEGDDPVFVAGITIPVHEVDKKTVKLYPVPAGDYMIAESAQSKILEIRLYDQLGQIVFESLPNDIYSRIPVAQLAAGYYWFWARTGVGEVRLPVVVQ